MDGHELHCIAPGLCRFFADGCELVLQVVDVSEQGGNRRELRELLRPGAQEVGLFFTEEFVIPSSEQGFDSFRR